MNKKIDAKLILQAIKDWGKVLILLLDEAAVIVVILLILHFLGIQIPLPIMIGGGIIVGIFVLIIHIAVAHSVARAALESGVAQRQLDDDYFQSTEITQSCCI